MVEPDVAESGRPRAPAGATGSRSPTCSTASTVPAAQLAADAVDRTLLVGHGIFFRFMFARTLLGEEFGPRHADWLWRIGSLNCGLSTFDTCTAAAATTPPTSRAGDA